MINKEILLGNYETKILICPKCKKSLLKENKEKSHNLRDAKIIDLDFLQEYGNIDMHQRSEKLRSSLFECEHSECNGELVLIEEEKGELNPKNQPFYICKYEAYIYKRNIKYMNPSIDIIKIPPKIDIKLSKILRSSFKLYWVDLDACANKLRVFLENFLNYLKIIKQRKIYRSTGNKIKKLSLGERIGELKQHSIKFSKYGDNIKAIKWIGNVGSHGSKPVTVERLVQAFEILEYIIDEIVFDKTKKIEKITKVINSKKGK